MTITQDEENLEISLENPVARILGIETSCDETAAAVVDKVALAFAQALRVASSTTIVEATETADRSRTD